MKEKITFSFGKNWQNFLKTLSKPKIKIAMESIQEFLGDLKNKTILDIGCGSGLFSYCMYLLGAKEITSIDIDPFSIKCTQYLRDKVHNKKNWNILHGSILNRDFILNLKKYDIVYSWGVLHHTGKMWDAIENSLKLVKENGLFYIAIYNKTQFSNIWLKIKKIYNLNPKIGKTLMDYGLFGVHYLIYPLFMLKNPFKELKNYQKNRGMHPIIDIKDWLGGFPFEFARFEEIVNYINKVDRKFKLVKFKRFENSTNNLFLFKKPS